MRQILTKVVAQNLRPDQRHADGAERADGRERIGQRSRRLRHGERANDEDGDEAPEHAPSGDAARQDQVLPKQRDLWPARRIQSEGRGPPAGPIRRVTSGPPGHLLLRITRGRFLEGHIRAEHPNVVRQERAEADWQRRQELRTIAAERQTHQRPERPEHELHGPAARDPLNGHEELLGRRDGRQRRPGEGHGRGDDRDRAEDDGEGNPLTRESGASVRAEALTPQRDPGQVQIDRGHHEQHAEKERPPLRERAGTEHERDERASENRSDLRPQHLVVQELSPRDGCGEQKLHIGSGERHGGAAGTGKNPGHGRRREQPGGTQDPQHQAAVVEPRQR